MKIMIKECTSDEVNILQELSLKTFCEAFLHLNTQRNMKNYIEKAFNSDKLYTELSNKDSAFYFIYTDEILSGYIKLNEAPAQTDIQDPDSLEIERIYVVKENQSKGLGLILLNKAIEVAKSKDKTYMWLGVWEKNKKALSFYKRHGFYEFGKHYFIMGDDKQTDYILRKDIG